jgi:ABC-2 type transport system ATP-binding protein
MDAIKTQNLTKSFEAHMAVDGVTFTVARGEIFGLVGPDGAGKTTTMRLLTAIMEPSAGDAWIYGMHIVNDAESIKEKIGYMSQRFGLYPDLTVLENIHFYADIYGVARKGRLEKIDKLLSFSNLTPFKKRLAGNLSGGMKQKLGLACALIHTPDVLFLDEPTNGVDPASRRDFWRILYQLLKEKVTIFVSTAYLDEAERCNRLGLIHRGKLIAVGTPEEVKTLMQGFIFEVRTTAARKAEKLLQKNLKSGSVGLFGDRIHVVTHKPEIMAQELNDILFQARIDVKDIRPVEPSLEDVFVSVLTTEKGAGIHG